MAARTFRKVSYNNKHYPSRYTLDDGCVRITPRAGAL